jgi:hypothetical protein
MTKQWTTVTSNKIGIVSINPPTPIDTLNDSWKKYLSTSLETYLKRAINTNKYVCDLK